MRDEHKLRYINRDGSLVAHSSLEPHEDMGAPKPIFGLSTVARHLRKTTPDDALYSNRGKRRGRNILTAQMNSR